MKVITATGRELECESISSIPTPPRLYLQLADMGVEEAIAVFSDRNELPLQGYPSFTELQNVIDEGSAKVRITLKIEET